MGRCPCTDVTRGCARCHLLSKNGEGLGLKSSGNISGGFWWALCLPSPPLPSAHRRRDNAHEATATPRFAQRIPGLASPDGFLGWLQPSLLIPAPLLPANRSHIQVSRAHGPAGAASLSSKKERQQQQKKSPSRFPDLTSSLKTSTPAAALPSAVTDLLLPFNSSNFISRMQGHASLPASRAWYPSATPVLYKI